MGKKKFIDKKKAATFQLLARDSSDPNYNDSPGSDRIFVRVDNSNYTMNSFFNDDSCDRGSCQHGDDDNAIFSYAPEDNDGGDDDDRVFGNPTAFNGGIAGAARGTGLPEYVRREILQLGFPDDGYNYLIHFREIKDTGGGSAFYQNPKARLDQLPHDVKAYDASRLQISQVKGNSDEKSIYGIASGAVNVRVQKAVDPDVTALLDDSDLSRFGSDVEDLEEDFVVQANLPEEEGKDLDIRNKLTLAEELEASNNRDYPTFSHHDNAFRLVDLDEENKQSTSAGDNFASEKTRVYHLLDEQFDLLELQEYGSTNDDDYDDYVAEEEEESLAMKIKNSLNDRAMDDIELDEKYVGPADLLHKNEKAKDKELLESAVDVIRRCVEYAEKYENENEDERVVVVQESSDESEQWDCETIVSTYSNLDNHPGKIEAPGIAMKKKLAETVSRSLHSSSNAISLRGKEKLPVDFLPRRKTGTKEIKDVCSLKTEVPKRKPRGQESKDEKRERKAAVKEKRHEALRMKKETSGLYKETARRAQRVAAISGPSSIHLM
ncbi:protein LTV1 homolog isoform X2 [Carica papaya]|uniref:protein LTV1 homolog isoform X2 n=1 Tax=Carica papaya TaxID=3649 RepID=UPI000B8CCB0C|nr:protein LTV1 homolog isoform X2 [Carica papaya]